MYRRLAEKYQYTPQQISEMTHEQQMMLIDPKMRGENAHFGSMEEYMAWKLSL